MKQKNLIMRTVGNQLGNPHLDDPNYQLLTKKEVAAMTQLSERAIERLVNSGELPLVKIRGSVRYRLSDVREFIDKCSSNSHVSH